MKNSGKTSMAEFRAIIIIVGILALSIAIPEISVRFFKGSAQPDLSIALPSFMDTLQVLDRYASPESNPGTRQYPKKMESAKKRRISKGHETTSESYPKKKVIECQPFDPNTVSQEMLISMGVYKYVAGNLIRYRESGGRFVSREDVRKIYGMDSTLYRALYPCIEIPDAQDRVQAFREVREVNILDINTAGADIWASLPGIGDVLAARIIRYRESLGGFHSVQQVAETYGLPSETFQRIHSRLDVSGELQKLNLNSVSTEALARHPYISQRQAETIVNYRRHHGNFVEPIDLLKIFSLDEAWLSRIVPYLYFEPMVDTGGEFVAR